MFITVVFILFLAMMAHPAQAPQDKLAHPDQSADCLTAEEKGLVSFANELLRKRLEEHFGDSLAYARFLRQYAGLEMDHTFFALDQEALDAFITGLPWESYVEPEQEFELLVEPPEGLQAAQAVQRARQAKLAAMQYAEEEVYLNISGRFTQCLYTAPQRMELYFFYQRYEAVGFFPSHQKAGLLLPWISEEDFQLPAVQHLIAVEVFLQRCVNQVARK